MSEQSTAYSPLSEGLAAGFKIIFGWLNNHPRGELCSSDFAYFQKNYGFSPAIMASILRALTEQNYLEQVEKAKRFRQGKDIYYVAGEEEDVWTLGRLAFEFAYQNDMLLDDSQNVPASDRFVSIDHNSLNIQKAISNLREIEKRVYESNELTANKDERLAIIREVSGLRELLNEPVVRVGSIWTATRQNSILIWLTEHGSDAALNAVAIETVGHLLKFFGLN